jgi:serine/threonine-protein kinase RsbW
MEEVMAEDPITRCDFDATKLSLRLDVTLAADEEAVITLVEQIMDSVTGMGCAAGKEHDVRLAIHEALMNAAVHGCQKDPTKSIQCCVLCDEERGMLIIVRDPGSGFDPASIPSPVVGENIYATHGRGIFLINQLVDEVRFERGGTEIHMRVR